MSNAYIIEVNDTAVGLVSRDANVYRFHAVVPRVNALNGQIFSSPAHATQAARRILKKGSYQQEMRLAS